MGNFNRNSGGGGGRGGGGFGAGGNRGGGRFGGGGGNFRGGGGDREMHPATCSDCGRDCKVPFRPSGNKPVFCSDCFEQQDGGGRNDRGFDRRPSFNNRNDRPAHKPQPNYKKDFAALNDKLDMVLEFVMEKYFSPE